MIVIRIKAYVIDFLLLALAFLIIQSLFPKTDYLKTLERDQNAIVEDYLAHRIDFEDYVKDYGHLFYEANMERRLPYVLYLCFMIGYFVLLPYLWKGRTIGCYLCNVQVENFHQGKLRLWQLFIRYSIVFGIFYVLCNNICLVILPSSNYFIAMSLLALFQFVLAFFSACTVLFQKEKRGLHELISNTELTRIIDKKRIEELEQQKLRNEGKD